MMTPWFERVLAVAFAVSPLREFGGRCSAGWQSVGELFDEPACDRGSEQPVAGGDHAYRVGEAGQWRALEQGAAGARSCAGGK
jgi:hypothetical protein